MTAQTWKNFSTSAQSAVQRPIVEYVAQPRKSFSTTVELDNLLFDLSKTHLDDSSFAAFGDLLRGVHFDRYRAAMFAGETINSTENRAVLHTALRRPAADAVLIEGSNAVGEIHGVLSRMRDFVNSVHSGERRGRTGQVFTDVVNIGIGGSDLGPRFVCDALRNSANGGLNVHFVSNVDATQIFDVLSKCPPETTLFLVASKTFTTQETMMNAATARSWFLEQGGSVEDIALHFVALSTNAKAVQEFGITKEATFGFWDWVGGRYSLWSAIGLSIALSIGFEGFEELLAGAAVADRHFLEAPPEHNIPVLMAFMNAFYRNGCGCESFAVLPYFERLRLLPKYLQQVDMESNGKSTTIAGQPPAVKTGAVLWGEPGTDSQHSFFQLLHQGTSLVPCDFIGVIRPGHTAGHHHQALMANFFAQTEALMKGKSKLQVEQELRSAGASQEEIEALAAHKVFEGNRPSLSILMEELTPRSLGTLLALYEHKIFTLGVLWEINSFDQWGVELGKQLAKTILTELEAEGEITSHDPSTNALINFYKNKS